MSQGVTDGAISAPFSISSVTVPCCFAAIASGCCNSKYLKLSEHSQCSGISRTDQLGLFSLIGFVLCFSAALCLALAVLPPRWKFSSQRQSSSLGLSLTVLSPLSRQCWRLAGRKVPCLTSHQQRQQPLRALFCPWPFQERCTGISAA